MNAQPPNALPVPFSRVLSFRTEVVDVDNPVRTLYARPAGRRGTDPFRAVPRNTVLLKLR